MQNVTTVAKPTTPLVATVAKPKFVYRHTNKLMDVASSDALKTRNAKIPKRFRK